MDGLQLFDGFLQGLPLQEIPGYVLAALQHVLAMAGNGVDFWDGFVQALPEEPNDVGGFNVFSDGLLSQTMLDRMLEIKNDITVVKNDSTQLVRTMCYYAKIIAGFLCLFHFSGKAYGYMVGEEEWKILPLLRPFALLLVILFWAQFCSYLQWPGRQLERAAYKNIRQQNELVAEKAAERWEKIDTLTARIYTKAAMVNNANDAWQNDDMLQTITSWLTVEDYNDLSQKLIAGGSWVFKAMIWGFTLVIEKLGLIFLQFSIVLILMMQALFMGILYIIGPLAFGFSVLGIWRNSWSAWVARYLSVTFYSVILFVALSVIFTILKDSICHELYTLNNLINETNDPLKDWDGFYEYAGALTGQACMFIVSVMAACGATMYVPVCSTWIIETSGTAQAAGGVTAGVGIVTMGATTAVRTGGAVIGGIGRGIGGNAH